MTPCPPRHRDGHPILRSGMSPAGAPAGGMVGGANALKNVPGGVAFSTDLFSPSGGVVRRPYVTGAAGDRSRWYTGRESCVQRAGARTCPLEEV
ncbi:hypothetical protein E2C01_096118 [Portunus trituberculatus]|uniref:Uncharacterized protein n=1 Tax=Portunus trituberculatus TaxID=210409 RepID=A0A5B7JX60_PORTR|nr:hypothetical protein [Portunus trituberculatus]